MCSRNAITDSHKKTLWGSEFQMVEAEVSLWNLNKFGHVRAW